MKVLDCLFDGDINIYSYYRVWQDGCSVSIPMSIYEPMSRLHVAKIIFLFDLYGYEKCGNLEWNSRLALNKMQDGLMETAKEACNYYLTWGGNYNLYFRKVLGI